MIGIEPHGAQPSVVNHPPEEASIHPRRHLFPSKPVSLEKEATDFVQPFVGERLAFGDDVVVAHHKEMLCKRGWSTQQARDLEGSGWHCLHSDAELRHRSSAGSLPSF